MDAVKYLIEVERMCDAYKTTCAHCPLLGLKSEAGLLCRKYREEYPQETVDCVEKWSREHPIKTNLEVLYATFGREEVNENILVSQKWLYSEYKGNKNDNKNM